MFRLNFLNYGVIIINGFNSFGGFIVYFELRWVDLIIFSLIFFIVFVFSLGRVIECVLI